MLSDQVIHEVIYQVIDSLTAARGVP
jgi:hypothetical protein